MKHPQTIAKIISISIISLLLGFGFYRLDNIQLENTGEAAASNELTLSAAASLKDALEEIGQLYRQKYPNTKIIYNFASSGSLQRQIEQGAPVDVFISAASSKMDALEKQGLLLTETRRDLLKNQMVLVVPANNSKSNLKLDSFDDLTAKNITMVALGKPESVPAGKYAWEILTFFKIAEKVNSKAIYGKDVRQVLNYVATGNVDAGIVYHTDALITNNVEIVAVARDDSHSPIIYPIAAIKDTDNPEASLALIEFLMNPEAQAIFSEYGFVSSSEKI